MNARLPTSSAEPAAGAGRGGTRGIEQIAGQRDLPQPRRHEGLRRLLVNACYREARKERRWEPNLRLMPLNEPAADDEVSTIVLRDELERGFRRLSIDHRVVVVLYHFLDLPLDRVAEILGIPVGTAHSRLHHGMRGLRAALDADARPPVREAAQ